MHRHADDLRDLDRALATEWLLADGAGGYASSTVLFCPARRYHGLWVPALDPPLGRHVILSHIDERLAVGDGEAWLSTTEYAGGFYPDGSPRAEAFDADPLPRLVSQALGATVDRHVVLLGDGEGVCITYEVQAEGDWTLDLAPMLALRSMHHLGHKRDGFRVEALQDAPGWRVLSEGRPGVFCWADTGDAEVSTDPTWYEGILVRIERERGFDFTQDLLAPGRWTISGSGPGGGRLFCSFDPPAEMSSSPAPGDAPSSPPRKRRETCGGSGTSARAPDVASRLRRAADAFIVIRRIDGKDLLTVIAGYPWFADWGRDAMIALPGLAIETGRAEEAGDVLEAFASAAADGLIPNRFAEESGQAEYNTVDASLWYLQALAAYVAAMNEEEPLEDFRFPWVRRVEETLWPVACEIVERYAGGTRFGIRADSDGLILAGDAGTQLTWMDARTSDGRAVTPRYGRPVEIQALWLSGLALLEEMAEVLGAEPPAPCALRERAAAAFERLFWNEAAGCLYDCILPDGTPDASVRPNQVFAVGLPHAPLRGDRAKAVVKVVRDRLLTPRGLRTLDPADPSYKGTYRGGPDERDAAYHQGTAWPWLLAPYVDAVFAVECRECARGEASQILSGLEDALDEAGLGFISEVYDGDPPHRPGGCIAQAWSVAAAIHIRRMIEESGGVP